MIYSIVRNIKEEYLTTVFIHNHSFPLQNFYSRFNLQMFFYGKNQEVYTIQMDYFTYDINIAKYFFEESLKLKLFGIR